MAAEPDRNSLDPRKLCPATLPACASPVTVRSPAPMLTLPSERTVPLLQSSDTRGISLRTGANTLSASERTTELISRGESSPAQSPVNICPHLSLFCPSSDTTDFKQSPTPDRNLVRRNSWLRTSLRRSSPNTDTLVPPKRWGSFR